MADGSGWDLALSFDCRARVVAVRNKVQQSGCAGVHAAGLLSALRRRNSELMAVTALGQNSEKAHAQRPSQKDIYFLIPAA